MNSDPIHIEPSISYYQVTGSIFDSISDELGDCPVLLLADELRELRSEIDRVLGPDDDQTYFLVEFVDQGIRPRVVAADHYDTDDTWVTLYADAAGYFRAAMFGAGDVLAVVNTESAAT